MKKNIIQQKSFDFAVRIVKLVKHLQATQKEFVLTRQLLKSGTSIGANIEEAIGGQSRADFFMKLTISYKECRETIYWIKLLKETGYLSEKEYESIFLDAEELRKIITKIQLSIKKTLNKQT